MQKANKYLRKIIHINLSLKVINKDCCNSVFGIRAICGLYTVPTYMEVDIDKNKDIAFIFITVL